MLGVILLDASRDISANVRKLKSDLVKFSEPDAVLLPELLSLRELIDVITQNGGHEYFSIVFCQLYGD